MNSDVIKPMPPDSCFDGKPRKIFVTEHAGLRAQQRFGWSHNYVQEQAQKAYEQGNMLKGLYIYKGVLYAFEKRKGKGRGLHLRTVFKFEDLNQYVGEK